MFDDTNPIARQLGGSDMPPRPKGGNVRRRVPLYRQRWFVAVSVGVLIIGITLFAVVMAILKPLREQAKAFDLEALHKIEQASLIYDRRGDELGRIFVLNRVPIKIEQVPQHFISALTSQEDERFFQHSGVDMMGVLRALWLNYKAGEETQGASTITQQLAREAFKLKELEKTGAKNARYERKIVEWFLAERIEERYSKSEILELYLNRIFFGRQFNGIQAAAQGYFGKDVKDLTVEESATIAGIIKSPNNLEPLRFPERAKKARDHVFDRMHEEGHLSRSERDQLKAKPVVTAPRGVGARQTYVFEEIRHEVARIIGDEEAAIGGFHIFTTVDAKLQKAAEAAMKQRLESVESQPGYPHQTFAQYRAELAAFKQRIDAKTVPANTPKPGPQYLQGALLAIDNRDGAVLAMVGGRDFLESMFNRAVQMRRPAGTAFVPFVYATAFQSPDYFPPQQLEDGPLDNRRVMIGGTQGILGEWGAEKVEKIRYAENGAISAREALLQGRNAATVRLGEKVGLDAIVDLAGRAGFADVLRAPSAFLGATEVKLDEMCLAYSAFARNGRRPKALTLVHRITDKAGKVIYQVKEDADSQVASVMDEIAAYQTHSCLVDALARGTGAPASAEYGLKKFPAAGKTGTHYEFKDLWFLGYSSAVTCGVWCGFDQQKPIYEYAFSNRIALPIWTDVMNASIADYKPEEFAPPPDAQFVEVCRTSGMRATDACYEKEPDTVHGGTKAVRSTYREVLRPQSLFDSFCDVHRGNALSHDLLGLRASNDFASGITGDHGLVANVPPVRMKGLTVVGADPYNTVQPILRAEPVNEDGTTVMRAVPVEEESAPPSPIKLTPPPPLNLE
ncbi:MAG: transglycosylase domain-containing protein [Roseimicrobium sp.]